MACFEGEMHSSTPRTCLDVPTDKSEYCTAQASGRSRNPAAVRHALPPPPRLHTPFLPVCLQGVQPPRHSQEGPSIDDCRTGLDTASY